MSIKKMKKEDLELLSNKEITCLILDESKKSMNTADIFRKIIELLELPESTFENKIADFYTSLATDKRFILLKDGTWDLRNRHTSDKVVKIADEDDEEEEI
ncbi:MAG: DNA-directed RNA polymerase subunit delta, partial [Bacilli bacterium]|nr:DNA-directed RNA polymerase subunit delta [Bacilli bacterium]